ncbi:hypothetical protein PS898_05348 [Pseudomonas fluorescens]|nr:hypothetical protein PS898_05348 [Pseudomonas fluorescens]
MAQHLQIRVIEIHANIPALNYCFFAAPSPPSFHCH